MKKKESIVEKETRDKGLNTETIQQDSNSNDTGNDSDVSAEERRLLAQTAKRGPDSEDELLHRASLDETDEDGTPLEEKGLEEDLAGDDLDVPGSEEDDENEAIGEEDEENNEYSLGGDNHDD